MNKQKKLIFSVIIPVYNEKKILANCLKKVFQQTFPKESFEVIVVNNASTDNSVAIAKKFPVRLIDEPNKGLLYARNTGFQKSKGKYIINLDADCLVPKNWLSSIYSHFKNDKDIALVTGPYRCVLRKEEKDNWNKFLTTIILLWQRIFKKPLAYYGGNVALEKSAFIKIGGYDLRYHTDQLSILKKLNKIGKKTVFDPELEVISSPRRTKGRFLKWIIKEVVFLYVINNLWVKITGKNLGEWEVIR